MCIQLAWGSCCRAGSDPVSLWVGPENGLSIHSSVTLMLVWGSTMSCVFRVCRVVSCHLIQSSQAASELLGTSPFHRSGQGFSEGNRLALGPLNPGPMLFVHVTAALCKHEPLVPDVTQGTCTVGFWGPRAGSAACGHWFPGPCILLDQIYSLTLLPSVFWLASPRSNVLSIPLHFILHPHVGINILVFIFEL